MYEKVTAHLKATYFLFSYMISFISPVHASSKFHPRVSVFVREENRSNCLVESTSTPKLTNQCNIKITGGF